MSKNVSASKNPFQKKLFTIIPLCILIILTYTVTVSAWFTDFAQNNQMQIRSGTYDAQIEIIKDPAQSISGDNLLWKTNNPVQSADTDISITETAFYVRITNYGTSTLAFQYQAKITTAAGITVTTEKDGAAAEMKSAQLKPGTTDLYYVQLSAAPTAGIRFQFCTAFQSAHIVLVSEPDQLTQDYEQGTVLYLEEDISTPDQDLIFDHCYPNINLNGHLLSVQSLQIQTQKDVYSTLSIGNGVLCINGTNLKDSDTLSQTGEGKIVVTLHDLTDTPITTTADKAVWIESSEDSLQNLNNQNTSSDKEPAKAPQTSQTNSSANGDKETASNSSTEKNPDPSTDQNTQTPGADTEDSNQVAPNPGATDDTSSPENDGNQTPDQPQDSTEEDPAHSSTPTTSDQTENGELGTEDTVQ